jgi:hypothetical protein
MPDRVVLDSRAMSAPVHLLKSLMAGEPVPSGPHDRPLTCVYCRQPFPQVARGAGMTQPPDCACGAPVRSALFAHDRHGVLYPPSASGWPR